LASGRTSVVFVPTIGGLERSGAPKVIPSPVRVSSTIGGNPPDPGVAPRRTWALARLGRRTIDRWKPDVTWSGSISATAPFVRWLEKLRKWSFRFGADRQIVSIFDRPRRTDVT